MLFLYRLLLIFLLSISLCDFHIYAQVISFAFPDHCDFIYQHDNGQLFLSSTEGLYVHNGKDLEKINLDGLDEENVQSSFFSESSEVLWFATYKRLVRLNLRDYSYEIFPLIQPSGDTLNADYYLFHYDLSRSILYAKADINIYQFNTSTHSCLKTGGKVDGRRMLTSQQDDTLYLCSYYYTSQPSITKIISKSGSYTTTTIWQNWPKGIQARDMVLLDATSALIATPVGLYIGDIPSGRLLPIEIRSHPKAFVECLGRYDAENILVSLRNSGVFLLNSKFLTTHPELTPFKPDGLPTYVDKIIQQQDGTIFFSKYDDRIYFFHPNKVKFKNVPYNQNPVTRQSNHQIAIYSSSLVPTPVESQSSCQEITNNLLRLSSCSPYKISMLSLNGGPTKPYPHPGNEHLYRYFKGSDDRIYGTFLDGNIYQLHAEFPEKVITPWANHKNFNFYFPLDSTYNIASANNEVLLIWNPQDTQSLSLKHTFSGDIHNAVFSTTSNSIALASTQGLILLDKTTNQVRVIKDENRKSCYCVLIDQEENIWYSSAFNIHRFNPFTQQSTLYNFADGVSDSKYLEGKCSKISADSLVFYHELGYTLIRPSTIKDITYESNILIHSFKVNDQFYSEPNILNFTSSFTTPYNQNTLSFELYSVDWSDPSKSLLRYKLEGIDTDWILVKERGSTIRYPKLSQGTYTLIIQGANSDGIWNTNVKRIQLNVTPPFWLTWWFITLVSISILAILYWIIRSYFQHKLEKKNQLLREQSLIIEKQQAVEKERSRIASEMHDDLGSGLTTIHYLSDKALRQAKDDAEAYDIKRIADHSNTLVRNMSEIIWAMNSRFDNTQTLTGYLRRYASEYFEDRQIPFEFVSENENKLIPIGGEKRRNLFLVFKEILHNAVKYSNANKILIEIETDKYFTIKIIEVGGIGFDAALSIEKGNGLFNCQKRMAAIHGDITFKKSDETMTTLITAQIDGKDGS